MKHQHGTLIRAEFQESAFKLVAVTNPPGVVSDKRLDDRCQIDLDRSASSLADRVVACIDGESIEPGIKAIRVAQARKVAPGSDERLLHHVAREFVVVEDQAGDGFELRDGRDDERAKGVMIAPACPLDEYPLVHSHPRDAAVRPHSRLMASGMREPFPHGRFVDPGVWATGVAWIGRPANFDAWVNYWTVEPVKVIERPRKKMPGWVEKPSPVLFRRVESMMRT